MIAFMLAGLLAYGGPEPAPPPNNDPIQMTVSDDDPAAGARRCHEELAQSPPGSTCQVLPTFLPAWAQNGFDQS